MAAPGRRWPGHAAQPALGALIMLPLQPSLADDREADLMDWLIAQDIDPDTFEPDPEDLNPYWLIN